MYLNSTIVYHLKQVKRTTWPSGSGFWLFALCYPFPFSTVSYLQYITFVRRLDRSPLRFFVPLEMKPLIKTGPSSGVDMERQQRVQEKSKTQWTWRALGDCGSGTWRREREQIRKQWPKWQAPGSSLRVERKTELDSIFLDGGFLPPDAISMSLKKKIDLDTKLETSCRNFYPRFLFDPIIVIFSATCIA